MELVTSPSASSLVDNWETMPIAVQMISPQNDRYNIFNIYPDQVLSDGYDIFQNSSELQTYYQSILFQGYISLPELTRNYKVKDGSIRSDDFYNIQKIKQYVAQKLPLGYIDMDQRPVPEHDDNSVPTLYPFISSFAPARNLGDYKGYTA